MNTTEIGDAKLSLNSNIVSIAQRFGDEDIEIHCTDELAAATLYDVLKQAIAAATKGDV